MWRRKSFRVCMAVLVAVSPQSIAQHTAYDDIYTLSVTPVTCAQACAKSVAAPLEEPHPLMPIHRIPQGNTTHHVYFVNEARVVDTGLTHAQAHENIHSSKD